MQEGNTSRVRNKQREACQREALSTSIPYYEPTLSPRAIPSPAPQKNHFNYLFGSGVVWQVEIVFGDKSKSANNRWQAINLSCGREIRGELTRMNRLMQHRRGTGRK